MRGLAWFAVLAACSSTPSMSTDDGSSSDDDASSDEVSADDAPSDDDVPPVDAAVLVDAPVTPEELVEDCTAYPFKATTLYAERLGFGASTTGGDWSRPYHVTTLANDGAGSLRRGLEATERYWIVFDVEGTIRLADDDAIHPTSNKTVDGRGRAIVIDGELKIDEGTHNVIFTDVAFKYPRGWQTSDGDMIGIRGVGHEAPADYETRDFWFHHLDLGRGGDGQLDNRGATAVTISWSHLHSHAKAFLHTYDTDGNPSPGNRTTYHHNFFDQITRRGPQFHYGVADFFNNYQFHWYEFGAASQRGARFLSEANVYEARPGEICFDCADPNSPTGDSDWQVSKTALTPSWDTEPGYIKSVNDVVREGAVIEQREPTLVPARPYAATIDPPDDALVQALKTQTGPRTDYCQ